MSIDEDVLWRIVGTRCDHMTSQLEALLHLHQMEIGEKIETLLFRLLRFQNQAAHKDFPQPKISHQFDVADEGVPLNPPSAHGNGQLPKLFADMGGGPVNVQHALSRPPPKRSHGNQTGSDGPLHATGSLTMRRLQHEASPAVQAAHEPVEVAPRAHGKSEAVSGHRDGPLPEVRTSAMPRRDKDQHQPFYIPPKTRKSMPWSSGQKSLLSQLIGKRVSMDSGASDEEQQRQRAALAYTRRSKPAMSTSKKSKELTWRGRLAYVVEHPLFDFLISVLIVSNAVFLGWQAQYTAERQVDTVPRIFFVIQVVYGILFFLELLLRVAAEGKDFLAGPNMSWNLFDVLIVLTSIAEVFVELLHMADINDGKNLGLNNLRVVRILRIVRLVRVIRVAKLLRFIHALRTFIFSILATLKALVWALLLLVLIIYVFGIAMTQACLDFRIDHPDHRYSKSVLRDFWGDLGASMYTLFKCISGGLSWDDAIHEMHDTVGFVWVAVFTFYIAFTYFAVLNVVTGIFCQSAIETAQQNEDLAIQIHMANKEYYRSRLHKVFMDIDDDESGRITLDELEEHLDDENMQLVFTSLEIAPDDAWTLFKLLDQDSSHEIGLDEFVDGLMRWRGNAKRTDVVELQAQVKKILTALSQTKQTLESMHKMTYCGHVQSSQQVGFQDKIWKPPASDWDASDLAVNVTQHEAPRRPTDRTIDAVTASIGSSQLSTAKQ